MDIENQPPAEAAESGASIFGLLVHQFVSTLAILILVIALTAPLERLQGNSPVPTGLVSLTLSAVLGFAIGLVTAYTFPLHSKHAVWVWIIPTMGRCLLLLTALNSGRDPFIFLARSPRESETSSILYTLLAFQSMLYALGARIGLAGRRSSE